MKRFKNNDKFELDNKSDRSLYIENEDLKSVEAEIDESSYKRLEDKEERDEYINSSMKSFRKVIGGLLLLSFIIYTMLSYTSNEAFRDNLTLFLNLFIVSSIN